MDIEPTTSKKLKHDLDKGTDYIVQSGSKEAHSIVSPPKFLPKYVSIPPSPRTPSQGLSRKHRKARRKNPLATPKITDWLKTPTIMPTSVKITPETKTPSQKRRRQRKKTKPFQDPSSSTLTTFNCKLQYTTSIFNFCSKIYSSRLTTVSLE